MNITARRLAALILVLAAVAGTGAAAFGQPPAARALLPVAALWLVLLGWGCRAALARQLRLNDRLAFSEARLGIERQARLLAQRALADNHGSLCRLVQQQEHVREHERNRIARDIHDDLGQHLLALKIELSLIQVSTSAAHPRLHQQVGRLLHGLGLATASLRAIVNDLRPVALEHGLQAAMQTQLSEFSRINGVPHQFEAGADAFLGPRGGAVDAMLFRILQELLANVARHAQASEVQVALRRSGELLTLSVRDDGIGMAGRAASRGCGLAGIADRVTAAGGRFTIDNAPGAGTLMSLSVPLPQPVAVH